MGYFIDSKLVNLEDLRKAVHEDGKRIYSEELVQGIENGDLNCLYNIDAAERNNKFFMEPLLYAVKYNSKLASYEVYKYLGEELQKDLEIAEEVAINEPEIIDGTAVSNDDTIMLHLANINPEVILYISDELKNDGEFIEELCKTGNKEAIRYAARECNISEVLADNPELAKDSEFMTEAIKENKEAIDYVVEHTEEFGIDVLNTAKDSLEEKLLTEAKKEVEDGRANLETEKDKLTPEQIKRKERDLNSIDRMLKKFEEAETPEKKGRIAHIILATTGMEQYQNMDKYSNGVVHEKMDPEFRKELEKYEKLYLAAKEREREEEKKDENKTEPKDIESASDGIKLSKINNEAGAIRETIENERSGNEIKTEEYEIGE